MASIYQKIPGVGTGRGGIHLAFLSRVYTTPDHLFVVQSTGFTEEYKRLFFRDICSMEVRHNNVQFWIGLVFGIMTVLLALLYFVHVPVLVVALLCLPFVVGFVINLVRGPTCECFISTNVQTLKLPAPRRVKKVATMIEFLRTQTAAFDATASPQSVGQS